MKPDAQGFDEIRICTEPRYKTSELSGDEWRISAVIRFYRNGNLVHESSGVRNVETAAHLLSYELFKALDNALGFFAGEDGYCDQEGCSQAPTVFYEKLYDYCRQGHKTKPSGRPYRKFCDRHKTRGDCGLDDADINYKEIDRDSVDKDSNNG